MSITEILEELPKLSADELQLLHDRIDVLKADEIEETPEMLAAIDEGIRSIETHGGIPIETVQVRMDEKWRTK